MQKILNLLPIITFFISYKIYDIFIASKCLIIISGITCIFHWIIYKKIDQINLISFILITILGSLTIVFHNSQFIKWKITIIYLFFSIILLISQFYKKPIMQRFLERNIKLSNIYWKKINFFWALFFLFCSILNIYITLYLSEEIWVNFKVFGLSILMIFSILTTSIYINCKRLKKK